MLKYSEDLKQYIDKIIPDITINDNYRYCGTFYKGCTYITDVDIMNFIDPNMNYEILYKMLKQIITNLPKHVKFLYLSSGHNSRITNYPWKINNPKIVENYNYDEAIKFGETITDIMPLDKFKKYVEPDPDINKIILLQIKLDKKSKIKWTLEDIMSMKKKVDDKTIDIVDSLKTSMRNIIHFMLKLENEYIAIENGIEKQIPWETRFDEREYVRYLKKEYYYILIDLKKNFKFNQRYVENINYILQDMYGSYKQIIMNLNHLCKFIKYKFYSESDILSYAKLILHKIKSSEYENEKLINEYVIQIDTKKLNCKFIDKLENDVLLYLNMELYPFAYDYLLKLPPKKWPQYHYLAFN